MVKLSSFTMEGACCQQNKAISRKRRRKHKGIYADLSDNKQNSMHNNIGIDKLPDDILIAILSRMSHKDAAKTSVVSWRWKYLWFYAFGTLEFNDRDAATGTVMKRKRFKSWVNSVLMFNQVPHIDSLIIRFSKTRRELGRISISTSLAIDKWVSFAIKREVQRFELDFSFLYGYQFPSIQYLLFLSYKVKSTFCSLRSLRLVFVDIEDEVVQHIVASCPHLEQLCIRASNVTKDLQFLDSLPNLKILEITKCYNIQSLELSAANLVSFAYTGKKISLPFKSIPNLSELTLGEDLSDSFIFEPHEHSSYSVQLVKLALSVRKVRDGKEDIAPPPYWPQLSSLQRMELQVCSIIGRSVLFFTSLIKASPQLREFRIEIFYKVDIGDWLIEELLFPAVSAADALKFVHENLKAVEMAGYVGCSSEAKFLRELFKIAPSLEMVVIDTESDYYDDPDLATLLSLEREHGTRYWRYWREIGATTRTESEQRAKHLVSTFPQEIKFLVK